MLVTSMITIKTKKIFKKSVTKASFVVLLFFVALTAVPSVGNNVSYASTQSELDELNKQIYATTKKLNTKQKESRSLTNQVAIFDDQIYKLQLEIDATQKEMDIVNREITKTNKKIKDTEMELKAQQATLNEYIRVIYEEGEVSTFELILSSDNFSDFVDKAEYLQVMQMKINETVEKIQKLKLDLEKKKADLDTKKIKLEGLKKQQIAKQEGINSQRNAKDRLLAQTKGEENAYRTLTKNLKAQHDKLQQELWAAVNTGYTSQGHVDAGDIIGYVGNSGYSTGCHLHFEIRTDPYTHVNPINYIGNGYFINPVQGVPMNVPYGYSDAYFPGVFHTGVDYADGCAGTPIRATAEGEIIVRVTGRPNTFPNSLEYGNYVMIHHANNMYSLYGHLK